jgi:hypothetical protein
MELAGRVFDVVTRPENISDEVKHYLPEITDSFKIEYYRRAVRMAALCHDFGHLPFSHAAEKDLLPKNWTHEDLTAAIILDGDMHRIWALRNPLILNADRNQRFGAGWRGWRG